MLLMTAVLIHANFDKPFYSFDDDLHYKFATERSLSALFFNTEEQMTYMPVSMASLKLDWKLFAPPIPEADPNKPIFDRGPAEANVNLPTNSTDAERFFGPVNWAMPVRIENGVLHALAGFILWMLLRRLGATAGIAYFTAAAWAVHPLACETVCWISERKNILAAIFGFSAMLAQSAARGRMWRWPVVWALYLLSVLSKPSALGFLPIMLALEFLDVHAPKFDPRALRRCLYFAAWFSVPVLISLLLIKVNMSVHQNVIIRPPGGSIFTAMMTDLEIYSRYIFNTIFPVRLSFYYGVIPISSLLDPRAWLYGSFLLIFFAGVVAATKRKFRPLALLAIVWFFGALGTNSNLISIPYWMQDRYIYVSSAGLVFALALGAHGLMNRFDLQRMGPLAGGVFVAFLGIISVGRSFVFQRAESLVDEAAERQPQSGMAHFVSAHYHGNLAYRMGDPKNFNDPEKIIQARRSLLEYELAAQCADITNYESVYRLRVRSARLMVFMGWYAAAREYLKDWLPPKHLTLADSGHLFRADIFVDKYVPQTLAEAWLIYGNAHWHEAMLINRKTVPVAVRIAETNLALGDIDRSIAVSTLDYQAYVMKARIFIFLSILDQENHDLPGEQKHVKEAIGLLRQVPANSESGAQAEEFLSKISIPK